MCLHCVCRARYPEHRRAGNKHTQVYIHSYIYIYFRTFEISLIRNLRDCSYYPHTHTHTPAGVRQRVCILKYIRILYANLVPVLIIHTLTLTLTLARLLQVSVEEFVYSRIHDDPDKRVNGQSREEVVRVLSSVGFTDEMLNKQVTALR